MRSSLNNFSSSPNKNNIGVSNRTQPMRNRHSDPAPSLRSIPQSILNQSFTLSIKCGCRFVEKQDTWVTDEGASNGDTLSLTTRELGASCTTRSTKAFGK